MSSKSEKIQMALGVVILIVGGSIAAWSFMTQGSTAMGESCMTDTECKDGPCLTLGDESFCTSVSASCPDGFTSEAIDVTLKNSAGFTDTQVTYCIPARLLDSVKKPATTTN